jgi:2-methylcitrate dehydratase PrpD
MGEITGALAGFAAGLSYDDISEDVKNRAKQLIFDMTGVALRSRHDAESTSSLIATVEKLGLSQGSCSVIGDAKGYSPAGAALINGALAHSLDFDDTHAAGSIHPSAPIVPAAFAAAEIVGASGKDVIAAIVAGYEIQIRLSLALDPTDHYNRGFHPTATCGIFAAAAAAGMIFGQDAGTIASAFGVAGSQAAGSMQFLHQGGWTKRSHVGQAAMNGLMAATLAGEGFRGAVDALEGKAGFLNAYAPNADPAKAISELKRHWETMAIAVKPYPSCRYSHAPLDAIRQLMTEHDLSVDEIESVRVGVSQTAWNIIGGPEDQKHNPKSVVDGQFSMPFCAAVVMRQGNMVWDDYAVHLTDPKTLELCGRVSTVVGAEAEAAFPTNMAGSVEITTARGVFERFVDVPKGEPSNFVTDQELRAKFDGLVGPYLDGTEADALASGLLALEEVSNISDLLAHSRRSETFAMVGE